MIVFLEDVFKNPKNNPELLLGILREVPCEGGDKESSPYNHEKPEARHSRHLSLVRD
jgi:hypothetical protein